MDRFLEIKREDVMTGITAETAEPPEGGTQKGGGVRL